MRQKNATLTLVLSAVLLLTLACSLGGAGAGDDAPPDSEGGAVESGQAFAPFAGLESIELLTPTQGAGTKPLFEWSPVEGAARYALLVYFPDGEPYWAWTGAETSVYLGGGHEAPPEDAAGPSLVEGMSWAVLAFDGENNLIASSATRPIAP
jgi:hypothetical protein